MDINFELYKVFYYVGRQMSFSGAATHLYISQSAVSQSIKQLEKQLGTILFRRNTKQVKLTHDGQVLYKHVEQAYHYLKSGERSIYELHSLQQGEIRIAAGDTICRYFLLPFFQLFNQLYPQIKINITNRPSPVCIELLKKGVVDVCVTNIPRSVDYKNLTVTKLKTIQDVFVAGSNFSDLRQRSLTLSDLTAYPLLLLEKNTVSRDFFDSFLEQQSVTLTPEIELGSIDLLIDLVKIGLGIACISQEFVEKELAAQELFTLDVRAKVPSRYLGILTHSDLPVPIAVQKFIELFPSIAQ
jgi:DNA-binding transcriptional LysR family regulator